ncbi:hypothetical protein TrLO_g4548 [Triparma laevis f. longispina]|uniref:Mitochondrial splicing suppressor 51-like C-terminal domain-containing protein n=1 Tax=Triparma laevis f. longispina TaxID=1714387 RepID=A0A9W7DMG3_9STRA|nr:hypothetical protein TrLO_g4548 [Triparma laevis f. longispina]
MSGPVVCVLILTDGNPSEISVACDGVGDGLPDGLRKHYVTPEPWEALPLLRAGSGSGSVFAYFQGVDRASEVPVEPNLKATILAMACGLHGTRLVGDVVVGRVLMGEGEGEGGVGRVRNGGLRLEELCFDVDLRGKGGEELGWLKNAAMVNYSYKSELARFKEAFAPKENICKHCEGVHFCSEYCEFNAWSHKCVCPAWNVYISRRSSLSTFPYLTFPAVTTSPPFYASHEPYRDFLIGLGLYNEGWWGCELDGWEGGLSGSAKNVDCGVRVGVVEGFGDIGEGGFGQIGSPLETTTTNLDSYNLPIIKDWGEYYVMRSIPPESPVALLLHFPLTLFYGLQKFAKVQLEVARMLKKSLTIHIVGVEKELNFLDIFSELFSLFSKSDTSLTLVFVVRKDMLPSKCTSLNIDKENGNIIKVIAGSYNDDLSPDFDCGTGKPDVIIGMNAGLYAYDSWRFVVDYLRDSSTLGIFTDYNEWSGLNCASLGGEKCRNSMQVNPFRQPLALPVFSMNLPQFANGFFYCFNEQELE